MCKVFPPLLRKFGAMSLWLLLPLLETAAQIFLKIGGIHAGASGNWFVSILSSPFIWLSLLCDALNFPVWMAILKHHKLSFAFPFTSLCYITIIGAGWLWFHETIIWQEVIGIIAIALGIALLVQPTTKIEL